VRINRIEWVERLTKLGAAVNSSSITPEYSYFLFSGGLITAQNGTLTITTPTAIIPDTGRYVPAGPLLKLLNSIPEDEVELIFKDDLLRVKTNKLKGKLVTVPEGEKEKKEKITNQIEISSCSDFIEAIKFCRLAASEDLTTGTLCGVHLYDQWTFGSDRYRIFTYEREGKVKENMTCTLPVQFIDVVDKYKDEVRSILFFYNGDKVNHVEALLEDSTIISSILLEGEYEDLVQYFPQEKDKRIDFPYNEDFVRAVNRQASFLSNVATTDQELFISIVNQKCEFKVVNSDYGSLDEEIDMPEVSADLAITICVNPSYIIDALNEVTDDQRIVSYYPDKILLKISGGTCLCIMPTIIKESKTEEKKEEK